MGGRIGDVGVANGVDARFDAQRGEFCAYVLSEAETPFGLTLGNFKTFATSTPKGGIRGLWDADTDQIIFGAHQIAYRAGDCADALPAADHARADVSAVRADRGVRNRPRSARHRGVLRSARAQARARRQLRRRRHDPQRRCGPGRGQGLSVGAAGRPAFLRRARKGGPRELRGRFHPQLRRGIGLRALVGRFAQAVGGRRFAARTVAARRHPRRRTRARPASRRGDAEAGRIRQPAHLRRAASTRSGSNPARARACGWRSSSTKTATRRRSPFSNNCWATTPRCTKRSATTPPGWPTRVC